MRDKFENLIQTLGEFREGLQNIFSEHKEEMQFIECNFSVFRNEIVNLVKIGNRKGLTDMFYAQIEIKKILNEKNEYIVIVSVLFRVSSDEVQKVSRSYEVHGFDQIHKEIEMSLKDKSSTKITFDINDLIEILDNKDLSINTNERISLSSQINKVLRKEKIDVKEKVVYIKIRDYLLYYRVQVISKEEDGTENYIGEYLSSCLSGISKESIEELDEKHEIVFEYK